MRKAVQKVIVTVVVAIPLLILAMPVVLALLAISDVPVATGGAVAGAQDAQRANDVLDRYWISASSGKPLTELKVSEQEAASLLAFAARGIKSARVGVTMTDRGLDVRLSIALPANPIGRYANFSFTLPSSVRGIMLERVRVGNTELPPELLSFFIRHGFDLVFGSDESDKITSAIQSIRFADQTMTVAYRPMPGITDRLMARINQSEKLRAGDPQRVQIYFTLLQETAADLDGGYASLTRYIAPVFELAARRSGAGDDAAKSENAAAILALAVYFGDSRMGKLVGEIQGGPRRGRYNVTLKGRHDLVQHYLTSAGLQIAAGEDVANALGEFKEITDTLRGGSGFSFSDIAADRAGVVLALQASNAKHARRIQTIMSQVADEAVFFPDIQGLPDNLPQAEFEGRYGDMESAAYLELMREIERRIALLPAYAGG